jgi:mono/diheme cytochrome c family protein
MSQHHACQGAAGQRDRGMKERRMKLMTTALAAWFVLGVASPTRAQDAKELFARRCASCHGLDGKGQTAMGKKLGAPDLTGIQSSEGAISAAIQNGKSPKMFPFKGKLTAEQIQALAAYVKGGLR